MKIEHASFPTFLYVMNFSPWRRCILKRFLKGVETHFTKDPSKVPHGSTVLVWGHKTPKKLTSCNIIHVEDGFLRSVGLGAHFAPPLSWVFDHRGIYYDPSTPSDLEFLLLNTPLSMEILERAAILRQNIIDLKLSKYNMTGKLWQRPSNSKNKTIILVPGQVESDASITCGAVDIKTNLDLLRAVRSQNPKAYIIYKPHPDVVAGVRSKGKNENLAVDYCDEVILNIDSISMIEQVDEIHTITSLMGFEALLRHKKVTCYGQPFYAGWGLTHDVVAIKRREKGRSKPLSLDHLVAGALILYPSYVRPHMDFEDCSNTDACTTPEIVLDILAKQRENLLGKKENVRKIRHIILKYVLQIMRFFGLKKEQKRD